MADNQLWSILSQFGLGFAAIIYLTERFLANARDERKTYLEQTQKQLETFKEIIMEVKRC